MPRTRTEHEETRLPVVQRLITLGWHQEQILYQPEWRVPKTPSEASKRELGHSFSSYPVDIAIFDEPRNVGDYQHICIIFETKSPGREEGLNQLEIYMSLEPRVLLGIWTNGSNIWGLYRAPNGKFHPKRITDLPKPSDNLIEPGNIRLAWQDLTPVNAKTLKQSFERLLNYIVATDTKSTRRDDQLNQLCNMLLIKLESDKRGKLVPSDHVIFQVWKNESETADKITNYFKTLKLLHTDLFPSPVDQTINLDVRTIQKIAYELAAIKLMDTSIDVMSSAFQVFRTASLKSEEGQYFTPGPVIRTAVKLMEIDYDDKIIDPACGTGGFLIECFKQFKERYPNLDESDIKGWAQQHLYGVDKDFINIKLTKAMMMILGDGSAHTHIGDSLRSHLWSGNWSFLNTVLTDEAYTCILTNPPFGKNLRVDGMDARFSGLGIAMKAVQNDDGSYIFDEKNYEKREIGIVFVERCYKLLVKGGRLGIVLPETYMFSKSYIWFQYWIESRFILRGMFNIPMEAFQGFC